MRILVLATDIYTRGGIARYTWTLASALGEIVGPENVDVLALLNIGQPRAPEGFRIIGTVAERLAMSEKWRFAARAVQLSRSRYDLVICNHVGLAPLGAFIRFVCGTRFWLACHGLEVWQRFSPLLGFAVSRAEYLLPISNFTMRMLANVQRIPAGKMRLIYNAVSRDFESMLRTSGGCTSPESTFGNHKVLLSVGPLSKEYSYKGYDTVIQILPHVLSIIPNLRYVIVGDGDGRAHLENLAKKVGVENYVTFAGELTDEELAGQYRNCDVFVLPSRTEKSNGRWVGEGFGRVYIEAALAGKPVVGSKGGGASEAVVPEKTGFLVDPNDEAELTNAIVRLLESPTTAVRMGADGYQWAAQRFTLRAVRKSLEEVLDAYL
jgi:phosphatidylinositol alpha-1,6-mannosyltransferase